MKYRATFLKVALRELSYALLLPLDLIIPKRKDYWLFSLKENEPWGDSLRMVFERTLEKEDAVPILFFCEGEVRQSIRDLYKNTRAKFVSKNSISGIWHYLRSKVLFTSYTNFKFYSGFTSHWRHTIINLWHGIPIKSLCLTEPMWKKISRWFFPPQLKAHAFIASSDTDRLAMALCMTRDIEKVWTTGLPRNDLLLTDKLPPDLKAEEARIKEVKNGRKLLLYAPTFREWKGVNPFFEKEFLAALTRLLNQNGYILGIRQHISDEIIAQYNGCIAMGANVFANTQVLLRNVDVLITDYSSIFVDFLLLDRPIIGYCYDYDKYLKDRNFLYDFANIFPGSITQKHEELINAVQSLIKEKDMGTESRKICANLFFKYKDANSTERVYIKVIESLIQTNGDKL